MVFAAKMNPATEGGEKIPPPAPAGPKHVHRQRASEEREREKRERSWAAAHLPGSRSRAPPATFHGSDSPACFRRRRSFIHSFLTLCMLV